MPFDLLHDDKCLLGSKPLVEAVGLVRVQIVGHQYDLLGLRIAVLDQSAKNFGKLVARLTLGMVNQALTDQNFNTYEETGCAMTFVLVVLTDWMIATGRLACRGACFATPCAPRPGRHRGGCDRRAGRRLRACPPFSLRGWPRGSRYTNWRSAKEVSAPF